MSLDLILRLAAILFMLPILYGFMIGVIHALEWNIDRLNKKSKSAMYDGMIKDFEDYK